MKAKIQVLFFFVIICLVVISPVYYIEFMPIYTKEILFYNDNDAINYRIPGLVMVEPDTVIAYCEKRNGVDDWADIDIVYKINKRGIWSEERSITENLPDGTWNNPVMVVDKNDTVHFLFCYEYGVGGVRSKQGGVFYTKSEDKGAN